jgi:hypothetical protein
MVERDVADELVAVVVELLGPGAFSVSDAA